MCRRGQRGRTMKRRPSGAKYRNLTARKGAPRGMTPHLAATARKDRHSYLRECGPLLGLFGEGRLDEVGVPGLRGWWNQEVLGAKRRSLRTGRAHLDALSAVLGYACDLELPERNPVPTFRETLRRRSGTTRTCASASAGGS